MWGNPTLSPGEIYSKRYWKKKHRQKLFKKLKKKKKLTKCIETVLWQDKYLTRSYDWSADHK